MEQNSKEGTETVLTHISPAGFIEQVYKGNQDEKSVKRGVTELRKHITTLKKQSKPVLILVDLSMLGSTDIGAHKAAIMGMRNLDYKKGAFYGPLPIQVLLNTLSMVAGMQTKLKVYENRIDAIRWLRGS